MVEYLLESRRPRLSSEHGVMLANGVGEYLRANWPITNAVECPEQFGAVFRASKDVRVGIQPIHTLLARPMPAQLERLRRQTGVFPRAHTSFDLLRRPFWVANDLLRFARRS